MNDRPHLHELIEATRAHLEQVLVPLAKATHHKVYFQTLVAVNVLKIAERETRLGDAHARAEWSRLNMLLGDAPMPDTPQSLLSAIEARNDTLCAMIREGRYDEHNALFSHLKSTTLEQLTIANPKYLANLHAEDEG